jgi:lysophospholipase L1-like esterase
MDKKQTEFHQHERDVKHGATLSAFPAAGMPGAEEIHAGKKTAISRRRFISAAGIAGMFSGVISGTAFAGGGGVSDKEKGLVFLFQGDSITDGSWGRNMNHFIGGGYVYSIASRIGVDFPEAGFIFHNRGVSGDKVSELEKRWQKDVIALKPDVLSILIGVNDAGAVIRNLPGTYNTAVFEEKYRSLLRRAREANPNVIFVIGVPFIYPLGRELNVWSQWKRELPPRVEVVKKLAKEFNAVLVDYPAMFKKASESVPIRYWVFDGCHPSYKGHELMAREWIKQVGSRLEFLKNYK